MRYPVIKIGMTDKFPTDRMRQIDSTGTPFEITLVGYFECEDNRKTEAQLFKKYALYRIREDREWFGISIQTAIKEIKKRGGTICLTMKNKWIRNKKNRLGFF